MTDKPGKVINMSDYRPHLTGTAKCMACGHEWIAVAVEGTSSFECPSCSCNKGVFTEFLYRHGDEPSLHCRCGSLVFILTPKHACCAVCARGLTYQEIGGIE